MISQDDRQYIGSSWTRRAGEGNVDTSNARNALLGIVGDIDLYKLLQVVAYTRRESALTADGMGNDEILFVRIGKHFVNFMWINFAPHD